MTLPYEETITLTLALGVILPHKQINIDLAHFLMCEM